MRRAWRRAKNLEIETRLSDGPPWHPHSLGRPFKLAEAGEQNLCCCDSSYFCPGRCSVLGSQTPNMGRAIRGVKSNGKKEANLPTIRASWRSASHLWCRD